MRGGSDEGRGWRDDSLKWGVNPASELALPCLMLAVGGYGGGSEIAKTRRGALTDAFLLDFHISILLIYSRMQSCVHIQSEVIPKAWKNLAKEFL